MTEVGPQIREAMVEHVGFAEIGKRMLLAWQDGLAGLRDRRAYAMGDIELGEAFLGLSEPRSFKSRRQVVGQSELLGRR